MTDRDGHVRDRLVAYHDDELSPAERAAVEEHLRDCPSCAAELKTLRETSEPLRQFRTERLSEIARRRMDRKFEEESSNDSRFLRFAQTLGVIAASVLLVGIAWLKALPASSSMRGGTTPMGPVAVSPMTLQPWERSAVTLRPDPASLPTGNNIDASNKSDLAAAERILDDLNRRSEPR